MALRNVVASCRAVMTRRNIVATHSIDSVRSYSRGSSLEPSASIMFRRAAATSTMSEILTTPSFPVRSNGFEGVDPAMWLEQYENSDVSELWRVGSFPMNRDVNALLQNQNEQLLPEDTLWDLKGMLSGLADEKVPLSECDIATFNRDLDGYFADSVLKKRRKKMNKHKHRKRKKALRMRTKKN